MVKKTKAEKLFAKKINKYIGILKELEITHSNVNVTNTNRSDGIGSIALVEPMPGKVPLEVYGLKSNDDYTRKGNVLDDYLEVFNFFQYLKQPASRSEEICVTFKPEFHEINPLQLYSMTKESIEGWFRRKAKKNVIAKYIFVPEYNQSGVLHFHGIVHFVDDIINQYHYIAELKRYCTKKYGRTKGKSVYSMDRYLKYMKKDVEKNTVQFHPFFN